MSKKKKKKTRLQAYHWIWLALAVRAGLDLRGEYLRRRHTSGGAGRSK